MSQAKQTDFYHAQGPEPHRARTKEIMEKHPEIRQLLGKRNPWSFLLIVIGVSLQFTIAYFIGKQPWWVAILAAFFVGTIINHMFIALVHDASHNLIFKSRIANSLAGVLVNTPMFIPSFVSFQKYHMKHHAFQGIYELDADMPSKWEAKLVKNRWYMKLLWIFLFPLWQTLRTSRIREVKFFDTWVVINLIAVIGVDIAVYYFWGPVSLLYLAASMWLGFGLSPVGGRLIQEHYTINPPQETYSYYGILNIPSLNVGYHNEHHDFPSVAWNYLPKIKKIAPEYYETLTYHKSWPLLLLKFIFNPKISLYDRVEREDRGGVGLNDAVEADLVIAGQAKSA
ncbi:MAG: fatty acid desaturase [Candidatus Hydrogenedentota bacterium]|nr:MAG: fatty acid desaturase [Candidatus Hydrogenedentota bacterium]